LVFQWEDIQDEEARCCSITFLLLCSTGCPFRWHLWQIFNVLFSSFNYPKSVIYSCGRLESTSDRDQQTGRTAWPRWYRSRWEHRRPKPQKSKLNADWNEQREIDYFTKDNKLRRIREWMFYSY
jgi:hypothetical protein